MGLTTPSVAILAGLQEAAQRATKLEVRRKRHPRSWTAAYTCCEAVQAPSSLSGDSGDSSIEDTWPDQQSPSDFCSLQCLLMHVWHLADTTRPFTRNPHVHRCTEYNHPQTRGRSLAASERLPDARREAQHTCVFGVGCTRNIGTSRI